jgi:hypothetical protein
MQKWEYLKVMRNRDYLAVSASKPFIFDWLKQQYPKGRFFTVDMTAPKLGQAEPPARGRSAIVQLRILMDEASIPANVRYAAARLSTTIDKDHTLPFKNDPVEDAEIIKYFAK